MNIPDIYTHRLSAEPGQTIQNCQPAEFIPLTDTYYSVGIRPWCLTRESFVHQWELLLSAIHSPQILAIGEAGLDKLIQTGYVLQQEASKKQAILVHEVGYPLVIHVARSTDEIIRFKRKMQPSNPRIMRGFRRKKELALQYIREGVYLSPGEKCQEEALRQIPSEYLFLETDESLIDIHSLCERAALLLEMSVCRLMQQVQQNINNVFFRQ